MKAAQSRQRLMRIIVADPWKFQLEIKFFFKCPDQRSISYQQKEQVGSAICWTIQNPEQNQAGSISSCLTLRIREVSECISCNSKKNYTPTHTHTHTHTHIPDPKHVISYQTLQIQEDLSYVEKANKNFGSQRKEIKEQVQSLS